MRYFLDAMVAIVIACITMPAWAAPPANGVPSAAARARAHFSARFYVMQWDAPDRLDYRYQGGELTLHAQHFGPADAEKADLEIRVRASAPGRFAIPGAAQASYDVLGCKHAIGSGSYVELTRVEPTRIEGRFELNGHCAPAPASSQAMRNGRFMLVFDDARRR